MGFDLDPDDGSIVNKIMKNMRLAKLPSINICRFPCCATDRGLLILSMLDVPDLPGSPRPPFAGSDPIVGTSTQYSPGLDEP
jgi:hypothetical protein